MKAGLSARKPRTGAVAFRYPARTPLAKAIRKQSSLLQRLFDLYSRRQSWELSTSARRCDSRGSVDRAARLIITRNPQLKETMDVTYCNLIR